VRLGPSTPGDYVRARVLVSQNPGVTYIFSDVEPITAKMDPPSSFIFKNIPPTFATSSFVKTKHFVFLEQG
jgi:hypothetical protein